jgi:hypothetical protein
MLEQKILPEQGISPPGDSRSIFEAFIKSGRVTEAYRPPNQPDGAIAEMDHKLQSLHLLSNGFHVPQIFQAGLGV